MAPWIWTATGAMFTIISGIIGYAVRLAFRLAKTEAKAEEALEQCQTCTAISRVADMERELTEHRITIARDYVSNETLAKLENRIVDAINRLGDRLDGMFKAHT